MQQFSSTPFLCRPALFLAGWLALTVTASAQISNTVTSVSLQLAGLEIDPATQRLYGADRDTGRLLQIDAITGAVLASFDVGADPSKVDHASNRALWVGLDGAGAVRRFDLDSLAAGQTIVVSPGSTIRDIAASRHQPYTLAVAFAQPDGTLGARMIVNGQLLEGAAPIGDAVLEGNFAYGFGPGGAPDVNRIEKWGASPSGRFEPEFSGYAWLPTAFDLVARNGLLYHPHGAIIRASDFGYEGWIWEASSIGLSAAPGRYQIAWDQAADHLVYLRDLHSLRIYEPATRRLRGTADLGIAASFEGAGDLQAWSTNRLAFRTADRLFLVNYQSALAPADVEIIQTVNSPIRFGEDAIFWLTVTNHGPGFARDIVLTNFVEPSSGLVPHPIVRGVSGHPWSPVTGSYPLTIPVYQLPAGESFNFALRVTPPTSASISNRVVMVSENDPNPDNDSALSVAEVTPPSGGIVRLPKSFVDAEFNPATRRILAFSADTDRTFWQIDPDLPRISRDGPDFHPEGEQFEVLPDGRIWIANRGGARYLTNHIPLGRFYTKVRDLAASSTGLAALASATDTSLWKFEKYFWASYFWAEQTDLQPGSGYLAFSEDGQRLYRANAETCALEVFAVASNKLSLEKSFPNVSCLGFKAAHGLLYFQNGTIFDPVRGESATNAPSLAPPVFFVPRPDGALDVLHRPDQTWRVQRFQRTTNGVLQSFATRPLAEVNGVVLDAFAAGEDRLAYRSSSELAILDLPGRAGPFQTRVFSRSDHIIVEFAAIPGLRYQPQVKHDMGELLWQAVGEPVLAGPAHVTIRFPKTGSASFYRIVALPEEP